MNKLTLLFLLLLLPSAWAAPSWLAFNHTSSVAGATVNFNVTWDFTVATGNCWAIFEIDNGDGVPVNVSTSTNFCGSDPQDFVVSYTLNSTLGSTIRWRTYVNQTLFGFNSSPIVTFNTTAAVVIFKVFDENTLTPITFNLTSTNSTTTKNLGNNLQTYSSVPENLTLGFSYLTFSNLSYYARKQYHMFTPSTNINISGYLISLTDPDAALISIQVVDALGQPQANVNVTLLKQINNVQTVMTSDYTTGDGRVVFYVLQNDVYTVIITDGTNTFTSSLTAINGQTYSYILGRAFIAYMPTDLAFQNLSIYSIRPARNIYSQFTTIAFQIESSKTDLSYFNLTLMYPNGTIFYTDNSSNARGGTLAVNFSRTGRGASIIASTNHRTIYGSFYTQNRTYLIDHIANSSGENGLAPPGLGAASLDSGFSRAVSTPIMLLVGIGTAALLGPVAAFVGGASVIFFAVMGIFTWFGWLNPVMFFMFAAVAAALVYLFSSRQ